MTGAEFRRLALALDGTVEVAHFERQAFKVRRIFASLAPDDGTANILLTPHEQEHWCGLLPGAFAPVANKWGVRGWTQVALTQIEANDLGPALRCAWTNGGGAGLGP
jgi:hypothetical protein